MGNGGGSFFSQLQVSLIRVHDNLVQIQVMINTFFVSLKHFMIFGLMIEYFKIKIVCSLISTFKHVRIVLLVSKLA